MNRRPYVFIFVQLALFAFVGAALVVNARSAGPEVSPPGNGSIALGQPRPGAPNPSGQTATSLSPLSPVGSGFTLQGRLTQSGNPVNGQYDLRFTLYDALSGGNQVGSPITLTNQTVTNGLFTVTLDFGSIAFQGQARFIEIAVQPTGGGGFTTLSPRVETTGAPYALSLVPGATITGTNSLALVTVANSGSGNGISSTSSSGYGIAGFSDAGYGVYGQGNSTFAGVLGTNNSSLGIGVRGSVSSANPAVYADNSGSGSAVYAFATGGTGVIGNSLSGNGVYGSTNSANGVQGVSQTGTGVYGQSNTSWGVYGSSSGANAAVYGTNSNGTGVQGVTSGSYGVYGQATGNGWGVYGESATGTGVYGVSNGSFPATIGYNYGGGVGVSAYTSSTVSPAIFSSNSAPGGFAAQFSGNVQVTGNLSKGGGSFKIDHPLDPTNKYLYHSFVESPDMMDIYNGNVTLDARGEAWVTMPDWFQALNRDFRYQLTSMGAPGPNLYIAQEIQGNRFKIAGGTPGSKVSWQVTGIRHDPFAEKYRIPVEQDKPANERGYYLHPELYGQPDSKRVNNVHAGSQPNPGTTLPGGK